MGRDRAVLKYRLASKFIVAAYREYLASLLEVPVTEHLTLAFQARAYGNIAAGYQFECQTAFQLEGSSQ